MSGFCKIHVAQSNARRVEIKKTLSGVVEIYWWEAHNSIKIASNQIILIKIRIGQGFFPNRFCAMKMHYKDKSFPAFKG